MSVVLGRPDGWVNALHQAEVPLVLTLQSSMPGWAANGLQLYTEWIHPATSLTWVLPLLCSLSQRASALRLLLVVSSADLTNLVLKWAIAGNRPYWTSSEVRQFPMTCESGFGMPSGHMQAFAAVTYFFLAHLRVKPVFFVLHALLLVVGACSRIYTGAHFPTQTLAGWAVGAAVGLGMQRLLASRRVCAMLNSETARVQRGALLASWVAFCGMAVVGSYLAMKMLGLDPQFSVTLARRACRSSAGLLGLAWEGTAKLLGVLLGAVALVTFSPTCTDSIEQVFSPRRCAGVVAGVATHRQVFGFISSSTAGWGGEPESWGSLLLAAALGFTQVLLAVLLALFVPFLTGAAKVVDKHR